MVEKPKVLLVDDDPDFVEVTAKILQSKPYQVAVALNGEEGIRKIREEKPDIILLDIMMPGKDGYVVADEINKDTSVADIPVLALTSVIETLGPPPFSFKVTEYLPKTTKPAELLNMIEKHLKSSQPKPSRDIFP